MPSSYLTREGYEKSEQELEFLRTIKRKEVAQRLQDAGRHIEPDRNRKRS